MKQEETIAKPQAEDDAPSAKDAPAGRMDVLRKNYIYIIAMFLLMTTFNFPA